MPVACPGSRALPHGPQLRPAGALHRVRPFALPALPVLPVLSVLLGGLLALGPVSRAAAQAPAPLPAVVVWDFDDQTPAALAGASARTAWLRRSLSEQLIAALVGAQGLRVLERQRLAELLAEQKVSGSELADADSRLRLGRVIGAARMVFGGFFVLGDEVQLHVRVVDTATARVLFSDEAQAPLAAVMQQVQPLNQRLLAALGGAATAKTAHPPEVWRRYDEALALADGGRLPEAVDALQRLLAGHRDFTPAERQLVALLERLARQ